jgi:hypothetical protein
MLLLLASVGDAAAMAFAEEMPSAMAAAVLTCRDLAEHRLELRHPDFQASTLTVRGQTVRVPEIDGVINLLPAIFPGELVFYPPEEQEYQACEFHALLTFFLSALTCPVVNRPSSVSLTGPSPDPLGWYHLASRLGIPITDIALDSDNFTNPFAAGAGPDTLQVACLAGRVITSSGGPADAFTRSLARHANVDYLRAAYTCADDDGPRLLAAHTTPDLRDRATRRALVDFFRSCAGSP